MPFSSLGLSKPILRTINEVGYSKPTKIQLKAIPSVLSGRDVLAAAQTGTGKTASFVLPLLERLASSGRVKPNHIRVLVLVPTRELAEQVAGNVATYGKHLSLKSAAVYGGVKINPQMMKLRGGIDLLVAAPGRLLDLYSQNALKFSQVETLVLDEADRMLDLGFKDEIDKILALLPKKRQNLLFSATFSDEIRKLAKRLLIKPLEIDISPRNTAAKSVVQSVYEVDKGKKSALLSHLVRSRKWEQVLVFVRTKKGADNLVKKLRIDEISSVAIHGDKSQSARATVLASFKDNSVRVLVATDIAARGIDINDLPYVINYDLPKVAQDYIHRIGRTGRAGLKGEGISLVSADEVKLLSAIETIIRKTLVREVERGFIPTHSVPITVLREPKKPKKPKKKKVSVGTEGKAGDKLKRVGNKKDENVNSHRSGRNGKNKKGRTR